MIPRLLNSFWLDASGASVVEADHIKSVAFLDFRDSLWWVGASGFSGFRPSGKHTTDDRTATWGSTPFSTACLMAILTENSIVLLDPAKNEIWRSWPLTGALAGTWQRVFPLADGFILLGSTSVLWFSFSSDKIYRATVTETQVIEGISETPSGWAAAPEDFTLPAASSSCNYTDFVTLQEGVFIAVATDTGISVFDLSGGVTYKSQGAASVGFVHFDRELYWGEYSGALLAYSCGWRTNPFQASDDHKVIIPSSINDVLFVAPTFIYVATVSGVYLVDLPGRKKVFLLSSSGAHYNALPDGAENVIGLALDDYMKTLYVVSSTSTGGLLSAFRIDLGYKLAYTKPYPDMVGPPREIVRVPRGYPLESSEDSMITGVAYYVGSPGAHSLTNEFGAAEGVIVSFNKIPEDPIRLRVALGNLTSNGVFVETESSMFVEGGDWSERLNNRLFIKKAVLPTPVDELYWMFGLFSDGEIVTRFIRKVAGY